MRLLAFLSILACFAAPANATGPPEDTDVNWIPPGAGEDGDTWVRLVSGEWLRGEIVDLRDGNLVFDSEELDKVEYDWADVTALITGAVHTATTWSREVHTGFITWDEGVLVVSDAAGSRVAEIRPDDINSLIEGRPRELNYWGGLLSLGTTIRSGNTDQKDGNLLARLNRRALVNRWDSSLQFNYAEAGGDRTQETTRATSKFDWFMTPKVFLTVADYEYFRDTFQNVGQRHTSGMALGYDDQWGELDWDASAGVAWQYLQYVSVEPDEDRIARAWASRLSARGDIDITDDIEFDLDWAATLPFRDAEAWVSNLLARLSVDVWGDLELDVALAWDRQNQPVADADGNVPEKDDTRLSLGLSWDF